jgi:response regulator RpfG family c-di-GMP phosphodiesterase
LRADRATREVVIIAVSASAFAEDREHSIAAGCNDFISKPIHLADLLTALRDHLGIEWVHGPVPTQDEHVDTNFPVAPPAAQLRELLAAARIGYAKGLLERLERIERMDPRYLPFVRLLRRLTSEFRLAEIAEFVSAQLEDNRVHA